MVLVDTHVHLYPRFETSAVFAAAARQFEAAAACLGLAGRPQHVLCLTETAELDAFEALARAGRSDETDAPWRVRATDEAESLVVEHGAHRLVLVAGRQIVTRERLEVLALATRARLAEGAPLEATVDAVLDADALAVLPWGFGKWHGARRAALERLLERAIRPGLFLGDNANRSSLSPGPEAFVDKARRPLAILPGSDPLPLKGEEQHVGRSGIALDGELDADRPAADLRRRLREPGRPFAPYGGRERLPRFLRNQLAMQIAKRRTVPAPDARWV